MPLPQGCRNASLRGNAGLVALAIPQLWSVIGFEGRHSERAGVHRHVLRHVGGFVVEIVEEQADIIASRHVAVNDGPLAQIAVPQFVLPLRTDGNEQSAGVGPTAPMRCLLPLVSLGSQRNALPTLLRSS